MVAKLQNNYMHTNTAKFQKIFVNLPCHNTKTKYYPKIIPFWVQYTKKTVEVIFYYSMVMNEKTFFLNEFVNYTIAKKSETYFLWYNDPSSKRHLIQYSRSIQYCSSSIVSQHRKWRLHRVHVVVLISID